jgi:hypothetical protein
MEGAAEREVIDGIAMLFYARALSRISEFCSCMARRGNDSHCSLSNLPLP